MNLGLYCNWGITKYNGELYISSIHKNYIDVFKKNSKKLCLLSKIKESIPTNDDVKIEGIKIIELPYFDSYASSFKYIFYIFSGLIKLMKASDFIYIRVPEPFSWFATILKLFYKTKLHYHYVSFPLEVIDSYKLPKIIKTIKKLIYFPEYYLTAISASFNTTSCLSNNGKNKLPSIIKNKLFVVTETSYTREFKSTKSESKLDSIKVVSFLYVGRLVAGKGLEELIESIYVLRNQNMYSFSFTIVGDGNLREKLEKMVAEYNLKKIISFTGAIKFGEELNKIYTNHDVFVCPSFSEASPRAVFEATSNFLYLISTDVGNVREIFCDENEYNCTLIKPGSIEELVSSFVYVLENRKQCKNIADRAEKISRLHTLDTFVENIINKVINE